MARVTIAHVAEAAGVDKATVSRALRGDSRISRATAEKVRACARELGYRADDVARSLSGQPSRLVGLCLPDWNRPWVGAFLARLLYALDRAQLQALVLPQGPAALKTLATRRAQAFLWVGDLPDGAPDAPAVCFDGGKARDGDVLCHVSLEGLDQRPQSGADLGTVAARLLISKVRGEEGPRHVTLLVEEETK